MFKQLGKTVKLKKTETASEPGEEYVQEERASGTSEKPRKRKTKH